MQKRIQYKSAIFFTILFMGIICAPSLIRSFDDSIDITCFYGENEEEKEGLKLLFEIPALNSEDCTVKTHKINDIGYIYKTYPKPYRNLIFPPPEFGL